MVILIITGKYPANKVKTIFSNYYRNSALFRFEFSTDHYEKSDQILYSYKLEGFDDEWSDWNNKK